MNEPASLFPPTPEKILGAIQIMMDASLMFAETIAGLIITFVGDTFRVIL